MHYVQVTGKVYVFLRAQPTPSVTLSAVEVQKGRRAGSPFEKILPALLFTNAL
jgi:hypothetical protein